MASASNPEHGTDPTAFKRNPVVHNDDVSLPVVGIVVDSLDDLPKASRAISRDLLDVYESGTWPAGTVPWVHVSVRPDNKPYIVVGPTKPGVV